MNYSFNITNFVFSNSAVSFDAGYGFKDKLGKGQTGLLLFFDQKKKIFFELNIFKALGFEEESRLISTMNNSLTSLLYKGDYRDYYYKTGAKMGIGFRATENLALKIAVVSQAEKNAFNHTLFSIFNYHQRFRSNPEIKTGRHKGINAVLLYRTYELEVDLTG